MPLFEDQSRDQLRRMYLDAWRKHQERLPMEPVEAQIADVLAEHPEYHAFFADPERALQADYSPERGESNPFLHMGIHLAIREQVGTDRPAGIRAAFEQLARRVGHLEAEHVIGECLGRALWEAQRAGRPPDEQAYLESIRRQL
jgi:Domain of unknown function (DUF1841)